ncbi:MAG: DNA-binding domain-containing protein [Pseudomonadota bacterium]
MQADCSTCPVAPRPADGLCKVGGLGSTQRRLAEYILNHTPAALPDGVDQNGTLPGEQGMQIYHRAYRERLTEVLADSYAKCERYVGSELFKELAYRYIDGHPPQDRHLGRYGADFPGLLETRYPDNPELTDLAQLEWALREVFDSADVQAWTMEAIQTEGAQACLAHSPILHSSVRLHRLRTNAVSIWHAIDADEEVPEVVRFEQPQALAVWRKGLQPHFKSIDPAEAEFMQELAHDGASIAAVAQTWAESGKLFDPALLGRWMAGWWSDELLRRDTA